MCYNYVLQNGVNIYSFKILIENIIECMKLYLVRMDSNTSWYEAIYKSTLKYIYIQRCHGRFLSIRLVLLYIKKVLLGIFVVTVYDYYFFLKTRYENKIK